MESLENYLLALGIPGLLAIAFLDSAGIPLPGGVDVVVILLSWQRPSLFPLIALGAAASSAAGCWVLYRIGRTGGDAVIARFSSDKQEWVKKKVRENDVFTIVLAMLGPPPFPTKLFILAAGIVGMDWRRFVAAAFAGRLVRFTGEAYLAVRLGDRAAETLRQHYPTIALALVAGAAVFWIARRSVGRRVARKRERRRVAEELVPEIQAILDSLGAEPEERGDPDTDRYEAHRGRLPAILPKDSLFAVETFYQCFAAYGRARRAASEAFSDDSQLGLGDRIRAKDRRDRALKDVYYTGEAALQALEKLRS